MPVPPDDPSSSSTTTPSYVAPAYPLAIDTRRPSIHLAQHEQNQYHRRSPSRTDLELQDLTPSNSVQTYKQRPAPLHIGTATSSASAQVRETAHLLHDIDTASTASFDLESDSETQMSKRGAKKANRNAVVPTESPTDTNGHANTTGTMNGLVEHRRKHASLEPTSPGARRASIIGRSSFTLDDPVPPLHHEDEGPSKGFSELSNKDQRNFLLLVLLYFLQGIPMGLATGSVPFLLKSVVSYSSIGVFSLAAYPYSLKLFWSPIVDAVWTPRLGRRKSWILPIQTISGFSMLWLGSKVNGMMEQAGNKDGSGIWSFTWWWFALVFLCATQDIAVDGRSIKL